MQIDTDVKKQFENREKRDLIDKALRAFRSECLPFGAYPDYVIIEFEKNFFKKNKLEI